MDNFKTMDELVAMAEAWQSSLHDTRGVSIRTMNYEGDTNMLNFKNGSSQEGDLFGKVDGIGESGVLLDQALYQLGQTVGAPSIKWLRDDVKCPNELKELLLNWKFANWEESEHLLRQRIIGDSNAIRAVLSSQYSVYDNFEFVKAIEDAVNENELPVHVWRPEVGDAMRAYIIVKRIDFDVHSGHGRTGENPDATPPMGDGGGNGGLKAAIYIKNSEVGGGKVRITGGLYRSWCSNGMIVGWNTKEEVAVQHRFKSKDHMHVLVNEGIAMAMLMSQNAAVRFLNKRAILLKKTNLSSIVDRWADKYGFMIETRETWNHAVQMQSNISEAVSASEVINQLTAQRSDNADEQELIERCAGDMVMAEVRQEDRVTEIA
ncbi:hypothetical protein LCGC14_1379970 [marine sediment metagenome]|uniref:DUF932 domain-containing protein n=1 Tax=marine sediment metagenome TaxID=412755 RepID=A0A0F9KNT5_9ZZZZ